MDSIVMLTGIVVGVLGKYVYDFSVRYFKAHNKKAVKWDNKGFFLTMAMSLITALLLYSFVSDKTDELGGVLLKLSHSTQFGFFSQAIIGELGKKFAEE